MTTAAEPQAPPVDRTIEGVRTLLRWATERLARTRLAAPRFRETFCTRTPLEVLEDGSLHFTAPCHDLASVSGLLLQRAGIPFTYVLSGLERPLRPLRFSCGLEVDVDGATWVLGFGIAGTSLYTGRYEPHAQRPWVYRRRPEGDQVLRPFLCAFDPEGRAGVHHLIPGYDLERDLRSHLLRSGRVLYEVAKRRARAREARPRPTNLVAVAPWRPVERP